MSEFFKNLQKNLKNVQKNTILFKFFERNARFLWAKEPMSERNKRFAHLPLYHERPERMADVSALLSWATWAIRSFVLSDLSECANEWWANERWAIWRKLSLCLTVFFVIKYILLTSLCNRHRSCPKRICASTEC